MPRFVISPENREKEPTAEQRKVLGVLQYTGTEMNRQQAWDWIRQTLSADPIKKRIFKCWKEDRKAIRRARREAVANATVG